MSDKHPIFEILEELIVNKDVPQLNNDTLIEELQLDSLDLLDLQMQVQRRLYSNLTTNDLIDCKKISDLVLIVDKKKDAN